MSGSLRGAVEDSSVTGGGAVMGPGMKGPLGGPWEQSEPYADKQLCKQQSSGSVKS